MRLAVCVLCVIACGGSSEPPQRSGAGVSPIATQHGADDVIVAQVNGRPVWGSCVAAQAKGQVKTREAALDECVAFELLAQAAEARGLTSAPEVVEATRTALVSRVVELGFESRYQSPADLKDLLDRHVERNKDRLARDEGRSSMYARVPLTKPLAEPEEPPASIVELAQKLANERGLTPLHFRAAVAEVFGTAKVEVTELRYFGKAGLIPEYGDPLFAIPEVGSTYPRPVRSKFGWDVILLTGLVPARTYTREAAAAEAFPEARIAYFNVWVEQIARSLGIKVEKDLEQLTKLEELEELGP